MELSVQNSIFLGFLKKLDIDVKQFPERTFDGLFENVPELNNYFFSWFMEYITADNALTQSEQATYFHLASTQALPTEEEVNYFLSSSSPNYEDLMSLDVNYTNLLSEDLEDLNKYYTELSSMSDDIECRYNDVKKKQISLKEVINSRKKQLNVMKENFQQVNVSFGNKLDEVKLCLLEKPCLTLDFNLFRDLLPEGGGNVIHKFESNKVVQDDVLNFSNLDLLCELEEDLHCAEISTILAEGFLKAKREKVDILSNLLETRASEKNLGSHTLFQPYLANNEGMGEKIIEEIKLLETELFDKWKTLSRREVQKISDEYLCNKIDLYKSCTEELSKCKSFIKSDLETNSYLLHVLLRTFDRLENATNLWKQLHMKLSTYGMNFSKDVINFELRKQRFGEVMTEQRDQHLPLSSVGDGTHLEDNPEQRKATLTKIVELMSQANDDSNFITHGFRCQLKSGIKGILNTTLCGPTRQLLFVPVELLIKFYDCEQWDNKLSHVIKRLVNKYVAAKATVSKSDRKMSLLWIDFVIKVNEELGNR